MRWKIRQLSSVFRLDCENEKTTKSKTAWPRRWLQKISKQQRHRNFQFKSKCKLANRWITLHMLFMYGLCTAECHVNEIEWLGKKIRSKWNCNWACIRARAHEWRWYLFIFLFGLFALAISVVRHYGWRSSWKLISYKPNWKHHLVSWCHQRFVRL